jgi:hypothetical protein
MKIDATNTIPSTMATLPIMGLYFSLYDDFIIFWQAQT